MDSDDTLIPPFSRIALALFAHISRHGGSVRIAPLLRDFRSSPDDIAAAVNELADRCWVKVIWRPARTGEGRRRRPRTSLPKRFRKVERIVATRFGRYRYSVTW
jgi:hypothetical protein